MVTFFFEVEFSLEGRCCVFWLPPLIHAVRRWGQTTDALRILWDKPDTFWIEVASPLPCYDLKQERKMTVRLGEIFSGSVPWALLCCRTVLGIRGHTHSPTNHRGGGGAQAVGCLSLLPSIPTASPSLFAAPILIALGVYNTTFVFHPVPRPWRELTLMTVPGTNCEGGPLYGRIKAHRGQRS